jgi:hypothetical protein
MARGGTTVARPSMIRSSSSRRRRRTSWTSSYSTSSGSSRRGRNLRSRKRHIPGVWASASPGGGSASGEWLATTSQSVSLTHESARRNWWGPPFDGSGGCEQVRSPWSSPGSSLAGLATCEPGSRDRPEDHSSNRSGGSTCPFGQDEMYGRGRGHHNGLVHELVAKRSEVIPEVDAAVDGLWIHSGGRYRAWLGCWRVWSP